MIRVEPNIDGYFAERIEKVECLSETKAYITSIFKRYKYATDDLSKDSVTLRYLRASEAQSFDEFQRLADWIFFAEILFPASLNAASEEYYHTIARRSYYSCYNLISRKWKLFEELSDNYKLIVRNTQDAFVSHPIEIDLKTF